MLIVLNQLIWLKKHLKIDVISIHKYVYIKKIGTESVVKMLSTVKWIDCCFCLVYACAYRCLLFMCYLQTDRILYGLRTLIPLSSCHRPKNTNRLTLTLDRKRSIDQCKNEWHKWIDDTDGFISFCRLCANTNTHANHLKKWISCQAYEDRLRKSKRKCPQNALYLAISSKQQHFSCSRRKWEEKRRERAHTNERTDFYDKNYIPNANNRQRRYRHIGPFLLFATHKPFMIIITIFSFVRFSAHKRSVLEMYWF